ncbi:Cupin RmlC-type, partial [Macrophomina phaseolina MS6]
GVIHNPQYLGPSTEIFGLITPAHWIDFFRYVSEPYAGIHYPEHDDRNLASILIPKVMAAKGAYDVHFHPHHVGAPVSDWDADDERLPEASQPYYLKHNTGPRWILGGVLARPFATTRQTERRFAIASLEGSKRHEASNPFARGVVFPKTHHCLAVVEGALLVEVEGAAPVRATEGETVFVAAGERFKLKFASKFARVWSFTSGDGIEAVVIRAGRELKGVVLPDEVVEVDEAVLKKAYEKLGVL